MWSSLWEAKQLILWNTLPELLQRMLRFLRMFQRNRLHRVLIGSLVGIRKLQMWRKMQCIPRYSKKLIAGMLWLSLWMESRLLLNILMARRLLMSRLRPRRRLQRLSGPTRSSLGIRQLLTWPKMLLTRQYSTARWTSMTWSSWLTERPWIHRVSLMARRLLMWRHRPQRRLQRHSTPTRSSLGTRRLPTWQLRRPTRQCSTALWTSTTWSSWLTERPWIHRVSLMARRLLMWRHRPQRRLQRLSTPTRSRPGTRQLQM